MSAVARVTLPQQSAVETRRRLLQAGERVFARRGFGEAKVDEIASEAGVSVGAVYHHFSGKEELFRAIFSDHISDAQIELGSILTATSIRNALELFAEYWFEHLENARELEGLFMEFFAQATRDPWAREIVADFFGDAQRLFSGVLRAGQSAGLVRADLDVEAAATLLLVMIEGIAVLRAVDPSLVDRERLTQPWVDLVERFVKSEGEVDFAEFRARAAPFFAPEANVPPEGGSSTSASPAESKR